MLHVELKPVCHEFNNCYQGQVESIVEGRYHKNYISTQLKRWETGYDVVDGRIKCIDSKEFCNVDELQQIGLKQILFECKDKQETIEKIKEQLERSNPVIILIQIANCPWDPNYKKQFIMEHSIIINGYDEEKQKFFCCDTTYAIEDGILGMDDFMKGALNEIRVIVEADNQIQKKDIDTLLVEEAKELLNGENRNIDRLKRIADFVEQNAADIHIEEESTDNVLFSELYMQFRDFAKAREMMAYIIKQQDKELYLEELFIMSMRKWLKIRLLYVRICSAKKKEKYFRKIAKILREDIKLEEAICNYIITKDTSYIESFIDIKKIHNKQSAIEKEGDSYKLDIVDLSSYFNNKGFGKPVDTEDAAYSKLGEFMIEPQDGYDVSLENGQTVHFTVSDGMDNVICENQKIDIQIKNVKELCIIGNMEQVGESDEMTVEFENGLSKNYSLDLPEWYTEIMSMESLVLKQNVFERKNGKPVSTSFAGKLFLRRFDMEQGSIKSIQLPSDGRIHIFQIIVLSQHEE